MPNLIDLILNGSFDTHYTDPESFKTGVASLMPLAAFSILNSMSPEMSFTLSNKTKDTLATQLGSVSGEMGAGWKAIKAPAGYSFSKSIELKNTLTSAAKKGTKEIYNTAKSKQNNNTNKTPASNDKELVKKYTKKPDGGNNEKT